MEAKKFIAVERNNEITVVVSLDGLDCLADDVALVFEVSRTIELK